MARDLNMSNFNNTPNNGGNTREKNPPKTTKTTTTMTVQVKFETVTTILDSQEFPHASTPESNKRSKNNLREVTDIKSVPKNK